MLAVIPNGVLARICTSTMEPDEVIPPNTTAQIIELTIDPGMVTANAPSHSFPFKWEISLPESHLFQTKPDIKIGRAHV